MMVKKCLVVLLLLATVVSTASAFSGSLSSPVSSGIDGTGTGWWPVTLSWEVLQNPDSSWNYNYTFTSTTKAVSNFIIEVSSNFLITDIIEGSFQVLQGSVGSFSVGDYQYGGEDTYGMPEYLYGMKFDSTAGLTVQVSFDSYRAPVWGDFYAKDGKTADESNTAHNVGFTELDVDPSDAAGDGSVAFHILRPDSVVPEPSSFVGLGGLLAGSLPLLRRKLRQR